MHTEFEFLVVTLCGEVFWGNPFASQVWTQLHLELCQSSPQPLIVDVRRHIYSTEYELHFSTACYLRRYCGLCFCTFFMTDCQNHKNIILKELQGYHDQEVSCFFRGWISSRLLAMNVRKLF